MKFLNSVFSLIVYSGGTDQDSLIALSGYMHALANITMELDEVSLVVVLPLYNICRYHVDHTEYDK
jgi:hypothetical protein